MYVPYSLDQLTAFLAVVDAGSFSAAGRRLGRVQSAVSYAIAQLEDALGSALFDRSGRTPVLTDAGRRLAGEARLVLAQARQLSETAARLRDDVEAELRVAVDVVYPPARLADLCAAFARQFPATALRVEDGLLGEVVEQVREGAVDLGVGNLDGVDADDLTRAWLGTVRLVPVCAPCHPLADEPAPHSTAVLRRHVQIVQSERRPRDAEDQGVLASRTWRVTDLDLKVALICRGVGWGSLPEARAAPHLAAGDLVALAPEPWPDGGHRIDLHALTRPEQPLRAAGQWARRALALDGAGTTR